MKLQTRKMSTSGPDKMADKNEPVEAEYLKQFLV